MIIYFQMWMRLMMSFYTVFNFVLLVNERISWPRGSSFRKKPHISSSGQMLCGSASLPLGLDFNSQWGSHVQSVRHSQMGFKFKCLTKCTFPRLWIFYVSFFICIQFSTHGILQSVKLLVPCLLLLNFLPQNGLCQRQWVRICPCKVGTNVLM